MEQNTLRSHLATSSGIKIQLLASDWPWGDQSWATPNTFSENPYPARRNSTVRQTYKWVFPNPWHQQKSMEVSMLHEGQDHHGNWETALGTASQTDSWWGHTHSKGVLANTLFPGVISKAAAPSSYRSGGKCVVLVGRFHAPNFYDFTSGGAKMPLTLLTSEAVLWA